MQLNKKKRASSRQRFLQTFFADDKLAGYKKVNGFILNKQNVNGNWQIAIFEDTGQGFQRNLLEDIIVKAE